MTPADGVARVTTVAAEVAVGEIAKVRVAAEVAAADAEEAGIARVKAAVAVVTATREPAHQPQRPGPPCGSKGS